MLLKEKHWLGWCDLNTRMSESKSDTLTNLATAQYMVRERGFEPPIPFGRRILNPMHIPSSATPAYFGTHVSLIFDKVNLIIVALFEM